MNFRLTIRRKLLALGTIALAFVLVVGAAGYLAATRLDAAAHDLLEDGAALRHQMQADMAHDAVRADTLAALLVGRTGEGDPEAIKREFAASVAELRGALKALAAMPLQPRARKALDQAGPALEDYVKTAATVAELAFTENETAMSRMPEFNRSFQALKTQMASLGEVLAAASQATLAESRRTSRLAQAGIAGVILASMVVLLLVILAISGNIVRRIARAVEVAESVAAGDLTSRIEVRGGDEAAQLLGALAKMNGGLAQLVATVRQSSDSIATGTNQISVGNQDLSQRTEEQASNLQQTAASMEQISTTVRVNADTTRQASDMASTATASAAQSGAAVSQLVATMAQIIEASRRMSDIIGVIDGIAFQTNILALNAAVEAARAGEQGRGFAVVAAEVRTLAQRSADAAREIRGLIGSSLEQVATGERQAADAGERMNDVVDKVRQMAALIADISQATQEQTKGIAEVSQAVTHIDQVTQSNASLVEEAAAAAESLHRQATRLVEAVSLFRVGEAQPA